MRKMKWIFFAYMALVTLIVAGIGISFTISNPRDPHTLYGTYASNLKTLDPGVCNDVVGLTLLGNVFECLYNYKYGVKPYELFPELAAEMPVISEDGLTYTIKLRRGIHFYDSEKQIFKDGVGPEVKARDVVYSWLRIGDFQLASPNLSTVFEGKIKGFDEWYQYTKSAPAGKVDYDHPVEGLMALDDYTLKVTLTQPCPQFTFLMAYGGCAVVSHDAAKYYGNHFQYHTIGTGPYTIVEHLPDQRIVMAANPIYRGRPDVDGFTQVANDDRLPKIARLQYDFFNDSLPVWYLFADRLYDSTGIPKETYKQAIDSDTNALRPEMTQRGIKLTKSVAPTLYYYGFNMQDLVVGRNKPLRQAICMAFNRADFIKTYRNGRGVAAKSPIPPGLATFDPALVNPYAEYNVDSALKKMKEAETINGGPIPTLHLLMGATDTDARQQGEFFVKQMKQINLDVEVEYLTFARFQERTDARETQIFDFGWGADYPDEQTFLQLFYGKFAPAMGVNMSAYVNPDYDQLYEKVATMNPSPERNALYKKMISIVNEDCPMMYTFFPVDYVLYHDWLSKPSLMDYGYGFAQFSKLDFEKRQNALAKHPE